MLKLIRIQNLALIESAEIAFPAGFTAVTGETGAGKSVFLTSLRLCAGAKGTAQMVRLGCEKATVECLFQIDQLPVVVSMLAEWGIDADDGEIIIQRELQSNGKSRARINGSLVSLGDLSQLGDQLLQLHGQSEQVLLRDVRLHLEMLDAFADHSSLLNQWQEAWKAFQNLLHEEKNLRNKAQELAQQKEFIQFQKDELEKAHLVSDEDTQIEERLRIASGSVTKRKHIEESLLLLDGSAGLLSQFSQLEKHLAHLFAKDEEWLKQCENSSIVLAELARTLKSLDKGSGLSPAELERDNARLAALQKLQRKYRTTLAGLIELRDRRKQELSTLDNLDGELLDLEKKLTHAKRQCENIAAELHTKRVIAAQQLDGLVENQIRKLGMEKAVFNTQVSTRELSATGIDQVEFLIAPNPGEGLKTLRQAVSGGELSRVLLAFKSVMATRDLTPVLVFDEVDSGISGEVANRIGDCLQELGKSHQILTITHLHQVASRADAQLLVEKNEQDGRTTTQINILQNKERVLEIARMMGDPSSASVQDHAQRLLER